MGDALRRNAAAVPEDRIGSSPADPATHGQQLDHFQLVIPKLLEAFTIYALDMPGMGWSDITKAASAPSRRCVVQSSTSSRRSTSPESPSLASRWARPYRSPLRPSSKGGCEGSWPSTPTTTHGLARANRVASIYIGSARLPVFGSVVTRMENEPVLGIVLRGGLLDGSKLPNHYLAELRRAGRRRGYPRVAREVYQNVDSMIAARALYGGVSAPVILIYGEHDWSRPPEREANLALLRGARSIALADTGHFAALEQPARVAEILVESLEAGI